MCKINNPCSDLEDAINTRFDEAMEDCRFYERHGQKAELLNVVPCIQSLNGSDYMKKATRKVSNGEDQYE